MRRVMCVHKDKNIRFGELLSRRFQLLAIPSLLVAALALTLSGCGGGGSGDGPDATGDLLWIDSPTSADAYETDRDSVALEGTSFIPQGASCTGIVGTMPPGYEVTWSNAANGLSGSGIFYLGCFLQVHVIWRTGYIPLVNGRNTIVVTASDASGNVGHDTIEVFRVLDTTPPTVVSVTPSDGSVNVAVNARMEVKFSEDMDNGSINDSTIILKDDEGNLIPASVDYYGTLTAIITPGSFLGYSAPYQIEVTTGVRDEAGNPLSSPYFFSFTTAVDPDTTPPYVQSVSPPDGSVCAPLGGVVSANFSEDLDSSTVNDSTFTLRNASNESVPGTVSYLDRIASFTSSSSLPEEALFTAMLTTGIKDLSQNPVSLDYQWSFTTIAAGGTGSWTSTTLASAPFARYGHVALWTGSEMIVSGGFAWDSDWSSFVYTSQFGRFNPATGNWTVSAGAPIGIDQKSVWTGSKMLVWGGYYYGSGLATGGAYDPAVDIWSPLSQVNQPRRRYDHTAVWTGSEMIVWGGRADSATPLGDGARYDPLLDSWQPIQVSGTPSARYGHSAVWTGTEMIVWGGLSATGTFLRDGARYNPQTNTWTAISQSGAPGERYGHVAVWTGSQMIVWGNVYGSTNTGGLYNPTTDSWAPTDDLCAPAGRWLTPAVWTGSKMIIWGGSNISALDDGYEYDPVIDSWLQITTDRAPTARARHTAVWTGSELIVWGGSDGGVLQDGGILAP